MNLRISFTCENSMSRSRTKQIPISPNRCQIGFTLPLRITLFCFFVFKRCWHWKLWALARTCELRGFWAVLSGRRHSPFVCTLFNHGRCPRIYKLQTLPFEHVIVVRDLCSSWFLGNIRLHILQYKGDEKCIPAQYAETISKPFLGLTIFI